MSSTIDLGNGRYIAGEPDAELHAGNHWCEYCRGDGLEYDFNNELTICGGCGGIGQIECSGANCGSCEAEQRDLRRARLRKLAVLVMAACDRASSSGDWAYASRLLSRADDIIRATQKLHSSS